MEQQIVSKDIFAKRFSEILNSSPETTYSIAERLSLTPASISRYANGLMAPKIPTVYMMANIFNVNPLWLMGYDAPKQVEKEPTPPYSEDALKLAGDYDNLDNHGKRVVRLVADEEKDRCNKERKSKIGEVFEQWKDVDVAEETAYFIVPYYLHPASAGTGQEAGDDGPEDLALVKRPPRGTSFVVRVDGISMKPTFSDGDKLFVRSQLEVKLGQIGIFYMDGRQWVKELGDGELISHNPKYSPIAIHEGIRCQGLVLGVCDESYFE